MPELPEVETVVRELQRRIVGRRIERVQVRLNKLVRTGPRRLVRFLSGALVLAARRRGKCIVLTLSDERFLVIHLKMTGHFLWRAGPGAWPKHVHLILGFEGGAELLYEDQRQFGYFLGLTAREYAQWLVEEDIGPDPFELDPDEFTRRLRTRRGRIKPLLLNQRFLSGLGNIYTDEALFAASIHPLCPAEQIEEDQARRLHQEITHILKEAIRLKGSSTANYVRLTGRGGQYQNRHRVYRREGEPCLVCGTRLRRMVVGGRGTFFCPGCQPEI